MEPLDTKMKIRKIIVSEKGDNPDSEIVYVNGKNRVKCERLAVVACADYFGLKTSDLEATSEVVEGLSLNPADFEMILAIKRSDMEEDDEPTGAYKPSEDDVKVNRGV